MTYITDKETNDAIVKKRNKMTTNKNPPLSRVELWEKDSLKGAYETGFQKGKLEAEKEFYLNKQPEAVAKLMEMSKKKGKLEERRKVKELIDKYARLDKAGDWYIYVYEFKEQLSKEIRGMK